MTKTAAQFQISDVALKKICVRHEIPAPGRGYWAKLAVGKAQAPQELSPPSNPRLTVVRIYGSSQVSSTGKRARGKIEQNDEPIVVDLQAKHLHDAVKATLQLLRARRPNLFGVLQAIGPSVFRVSVSPAQISRATQILNALVFAAERINISLQTVGKSLGFCINDEGVDFRLYEKVERKPHKRSAEEIARARREEKKWGSLHWYEPRWDFTPTSKLVLEIEQGYHTDLRRVFSDGKKQRLEARLGAFIRALQEYAAANGARAKQLQRQRLEFEERERRRIAEEDRRRLETKRWEYLSDRIEAFERADKIERFLEYLSSAQDAQCSSAMQINRLVHWAADYARRLRAACSPTALAAAPALHELFGGYDGSRLVVS